MDTAIITTRIPYPTHYYLILPNVAAGTKGRYTVYRIPSSETPSRRIKVIGRELPLGHAKRVVQKWKEEDKLLLAKWKAKWNQKKV